MTESYNGWAASPALHTVHLDLPGHANAFPPGVLPGDVAVVLGYVARQVDARVEHLVAGSCWGFAFRPDRNDADLLSCHASGTAIDINADRHPNDKRGTFTHAQVTEIHRILAEVHHVVKWGGDFVHTADEMHFEIAGTRLDVHAVAMLLVAKPEHASWWAGPLHRGDHGAAVRAAKHRLKLPLTGPDANTYDEVLVGAVGRAQHGHVPVNGALIDAPTSLLIGG